MSIEVSVTNLDAVQKAFKDQPKKVGLILSRAVNRSTANVKSNMAKKARENYLVASAAVKSTIDITKATSTNPTARVRSVGKKISESKFKISPTEPRPSNPPKAGYKVQIRRDSGLKVVPHGFLARMESGHLGMFMRASKSRFPIKELKGPAIPEMVGRKNTMQFIEDEATKMLNSRVEHELQRELGAKKK
jgi:hypothetical protein